jgi:hypothetical protein
MNEISQFLRALFVADKFDLLVGEMGVKELMGN